MTDQDHPLPEGLESTSGATSNGTSRSGMAAWMSRLCGAAANGLPASGAGISVMTPDGVRGVTAASDPTCQSLEDLQFTLGEGPGIDAFALRRPVLVPDLAHDEESRWPGYAPAAYNAGVCAVFAFPLQVGAARLGVMDVYRREPGSLTTQGLAHALNFAELAVWALLNGQETSADGKGPDGLDDAMEDRAALYQAQGMVMMQLDVPLAEAMVRLRAHAFAHDLPLGDVAREVVARRLRLEGDQP